MRYIRKEMGNCTFLPLFVKYGPPGPEPLLTAEPRAEKENTAHFIRLRSYWKHCLGQKPTQ